MRDGLLERVWLVELDLLEKLKSICEKYGLSYCASSGTLLGAARHGGFIPWDDDMDLFLPWRDYKELLEVAPAECEYPYFFQSFLTEPEGEVSACRLRRSDTTGCTKWEWENVGEEYDKGIFIDIFPLFFVPDSKEERDAQKETIMFFWKCIRGHNALNQMTRGKKPNKDYAEYIAYYNSVKQSMTIVDMKNAYLNACAMVDDRTKVIGATSSRVHLPQLMWDSDWYDTYIELPFEHTTIRCPAAYEKILTKQYGDWTTPINNGSRHEMVVIDPDLPWTKLATSEVRSSFSE